MRRNLLEMVDYVINSIKGLNVPIPANCRFLQVQELLSTLKETVYPPDKRWVILAESMREFQIMQFVFEQVDRFGADDKFKRKLKLALKDDVLPGNETDSHGRDNQAELYVWAICQNAGLTPASLGEPDVTCNVIGRDYSLEAKRPKNFDKMRTAIEKAALQIEEHGRPGVILLDTYQALNPRMKEMLVPQPDRIFAELHRDFLRMRITDHKDTILKWADRKGVLGIVFHDAMLRITVQGQLETCGMTIWLPLENGCFQCEVNWRAFINRYAKGLPELQNF